MTRLVHVLHKINSGFINTFFTLLMQINGDSWLNNNEHTQFTWRKWFFFFSMRILHTYRKKNTFMTKKKKIQWKINLRTFNIFHIIWIHEQKLDKKRNISATTTELKNMSQLNWALIKVRHSFTFEKWFSMFLPCVVPIQGIG